jgi:hypothetical protein
LIPIYRRIRSKEFVLGIGASIAMLVLKIRLWYMADEAD